MTYADQIFCRRLLKNAPIPILDEPNSPVNVKIQIGLSEAIERLVPGTNSACLSVGVI